MSSVNWHGPRQFLTTRWSLVLDSSNPSASKRALSELCQLYWYPLYAFARRQGQNKDQAQDLTQEFFARLLESELVTKARQDRGRFRSFLLTAFSRFLKKSYRDQNRQKRGGGKIIFSFDWERGEQQYSLEPYHEATPEQVFEKQWALSVIEQAMQALKQKYQSKNKLDVFEAFKCCLIGDMEGKTQKQIGEQLGLSVTATKVTVHRMRERYKQFLQREIESTVASPHQVEEELQDLLKILSR